MSKAATFCGLEAFTGSVGVGILVHSIKNLNGQV